MRNRASRVPTGRVPGAEVGALRIRQKPSAPLGIDLTDACSHSSGQPERYANSSSARGSLVKEVRWLTRGDRGEHNKSKILAFLYVSANSFRFHSEFI